jgi:tellurite resistance protein TerC
MMLAITEISVWHWTGFITVILMFLALDLGVFHRKAHVISFKEALSWTCVWFTMSLLFAGLLFFWRGKEESLQFVTGYVIELSLSMDNVFVIALIFGYFRVPLSYQHRVLFWGIIGALVMRGVMIGIGVVLIQKFHWMIYVFGGFLVITGIKMLFAGDEGVHPEKNPVIRLVRRFFPVSSEFNGQRFSAVVNGKKMLTPLAIVLIMVETTDLIFAVDSIPAIFSVTTKPFIVFTSNVFAILGLRSLYFVLANAIGLFRYLKVGLSVVLIFVGVKMIIAPPPDVEVFAWYQYKIPTVFSLAVVAGIILLSIVISVISAKRNPQVQP